MVDFREFLEKNTIFNEHPVSDPELAVANLPVLVSINSRNHLVYLLDTHTYRAVQKNKILSKFTGWCLPDAVSSRKRYFDHKIQVVFRNFLSKTAESSRTFFPNIYRIVKENSRFFRISRAFQNFFS